MCDLLSLEPQVKVTPSSGVTCRLLKSKASKVLFIFNNLEEEAKAFIYLRETLGRLRVVLRNFSDLDILSNNSLKVHMGPKEVIVLELL